MQGSGGHASGSAGFADSVLAPKIVLKLIQYSIVAYVERRMNEGDSDVDTRMSNPGVRSRSQSAGEAEGSDHDHDQRETNGERGSEGETGSEGEAGTGTEEEAGTEGGATSRSNCPVGAGWFQFTLDPETFLDRVQ